ncbi:MAG: GLPGLI family protein [Flavobacteriaceae bacterium]
MINFLRVISLKNLFTLIFKQNKMKKLYIFILMFLVSIVNAQQDKSKDHNALKVNYKIIYLLDYQPTKGNSNHRETEKMYLYLADGVSKFASAGQIMKDSLLADKNKSRKRSSASLMKLRSQIPETKFDYIVYKGIPENKISLTQSIFKDKFKYEVDKDLFQWEIHPETKSYKSYKVQKATAEFAGRNYTAWFTSEIPIPDGPYKFNGLPGLIVKIADEKDQYTFELIEVEKLKNTVRIKIPEKDFIETDKKELAQLIQEDKENPMRAVESAGVSISFSKKQKRELRETRMKRNNPIELE